MSSCFRPAFFKAFGTASTGPIPMILGSTPATAKPVILAIGFTFNSFTIFSDITITKEAPSFVGEELPAVTDPPAANTGFNLPNTSVLVPALGPSSLFTV